LGFAGLKFFIAGLHENENKSAVMWDLNSFFIMQYFKTVLACGIAGKICKKYSIAG